MTKETHTLQQGPGCNHCAVLIVLSDVRYAGYQGRFPRGRGDRMSSDLANLWQAGLWGRQRSWLLRGCFVPHLHVLCFCAGQIGCHKNVIGREGEASDRCVCLQREPPPALPQVFPECLPSPVLWFLSVLALCPFAPARLSPGEGRGGGRSVKESLFCLCERRGNLGTPRGPPS